MYNNYFMCLLLLDVFLNTKEIYKEKAQMLKQYKEMKAKMQENNYLILKLNKSLIKLTKYWNINYFIH